MSQNWLDSQFENKQFKQQLIIHYTGESHDLQNHEIDAVAFAKSVDGYASFLKSLLEKSKFAKDVRINVSATKPGSFDAAFEVIGTAVEYAVISAALAPWFAITPEKVHRSLKN